MKAPYLFKLLSLLLILNMTISCTKTGTITETITEIVNDTIIETRTDTLTLHLDPALVEEDKQFFRYDTFGDKAFWSDILHIDKAILGVANGGYGVGVSPATALGVGLKIDSEALPAEVVAVIKANQVDLNDPATTIALLQLNTIVGVKGTFDEDGAMTAVGINCTLGHSRVDNFLAVGIGKRLDGYPNRDLNVGGIVDLPPSPMLLTVMIPILISIYPPRKKSI